MKPALRTIAATAITLGIFIAYASVIQNRAYSYYLTCGCDIPLSFRVQMGMSSFILRFWLPLLILFGTGWTIIFTAFHFLRPMRKVAATHN